METRERLLEAAIRLLQREGYARTTTRAIVAEADAHLPAVNYFFGSKERLLEEAVVEALRRWGQTTMAAVDEPGLDGRERLVRALDRFLSTLEADRSFVVSALEAFAQAERSEQLRARLAEAYAEFRETVAGQAAPPAVASVVIALFDGLAIQWLLDPAAAPTPAEVIDALVTLGQTLAR